MLRLKMMIVVMVLVAGCTPVVAAQHVSQNEAATSTESLLNTPTPAIAATPTRQATATPEAVAQVVEPTVQVDPVDPRLNQLWFDMSMGSLLVDLYNQYAGPDDIARADHVSMIDLLDKVEVGRKLVVFKNAADVEMLMPRLADKIDIIGYNLEHGPANRPDEQGDPVGSARRVRAIADQYGKEVAFGPDRSFALSHGVQIAPFVDIFVLQVQRAQTDPPTVLDFVVPLVTELRRVNPDLKVSVQIRTEGDVEALGDLLVQLEGSIDGVSILTNDDTAGVAAELLKEVRTQPQGPEKVDPSEQPAPLPKPTTSAALIEATPAATRRNAVMTPEPPLQDNSTAASSDLTGRSILLFSALFVVGVLVTGVAATVLLYSVRNLRRS